MFMNFPMLNFLTLETDRAVHVSFTLNVRT